MNTLKQEIAQVKQELDKAYWMRQYRCMYASLLNEAETKINDPEKEAVIRKILANVRKAIEVTKL